MNDPDAEYAHVKKLAGAQLKRWLVATVEVDEEDAEVVLAEKITGKNLLTTSDIATLLARLKAGPRDSITEKVKELKGDILALAASSLLSVFSSNGRRLAVVVRPARLAHFISDGFSLSALPCSDVSTARKQALAAAAATVRPAGPAVPLPEAPAAGTPLFFFSSLFWGSWSSRTVGVSSHVPRSPVPVLLSSSSSLVRLRCPLVHPLTRVLAFFCLSPINLLFFVPLGCCSVFLLIC